MQPRTTAVNGVEQNLNTFIFAGESFSFVISIK